MPEVIQYANVIGAVAPPHADIALRVGGLTRLENPPVAEIRQEVMRLPLITAAATNFHDFAVAQRTQNEPTSTVSARATRAWAGLSRTDDFIARGFIKPPIRDYPVRFVAPDGSPLRRQHRQEPKVVDVRTLATYVAMIDHLTRGTPSLMQQVTPEDVHARTVRFWRDFSQASILALAGVPYASPQEVVEDTGDNLIRLSPEGGGQQLVLVSEEALRRFIRQQAAEAGDAKPHLGLAERVWKVLNAVHRSRWTREPPFAPSAHYDVQFLTVNGAQPERLNEPVLLELTSLADYVAYVRRELHSHPAYRSDMSRFMPRGLGVHAFDFWEALVRRHLPDFDLDKYIQP